jgi:hypothetical protein
VIYPYYRISDKFALKAKDKPTYISNEKCLVNFLNNFGPENLHVIADSVQKNTRDMVDSLSRNYGFSFETVNYGSGSQTFLHAFEIAIAREQNDIVYFVEDDFLHLPGSRSLLEEAFIETCADYVTLYDHPDKYLKRTEKGMNPFVKKGGEKTRVIRTTSSHWKETNSTVMTFASRVYTLREDERIWRWCVAGSFPRDFKAFCKLVKKGFNIRILKPKRILIHPVPGWSTHGESAFLSPYISWENV